MQGNDGKIRKANTDDEANQFKSMLNSENGINGKKYLLVSPKGFHVRQVYSYLAAGFPNSSFDVLPSNPTHLGDKCTKRFEKLIHLGTKGKLDNLAKTVYQARIVSQLGVLYKEKSPIENINIKEFYYRNKMRLFGGTVMIAAAVGAVYLLSNRDDKSSEEHKESFSGPSSR